MVARIIAGRKNLGHQRQIFFVSVGGFDLHDSQYGNTATPDDTTVGAHANLLRDLSQCINAFNSAMQTLRTTSNSAIALGANESVVGFTASDFGRTFPVNSGKGSDHGWGNHHVVFGDGVRGGRLYGTYPVLAVNGSDDTQLGRWIPRTSGGEYSATLAKWFGVPPTNLSTIFPNLPRFADYTSTDLGFFAPAASPAPIPTDTVTATANPVVVPSQPAGKTKPLKPVKPTKPTPVSRTTTMR
jgi:uncharacterized protein (DUF1501 family)